VPRNRGKNTTLLASLRTEGMEPALAVEGTTNREVFEAYVERVSEAQKARGYPSETRRLQKRGRRIVHYAPVLCHLPYRLLEQLEPRSYGDVAIGP
jgi:hypothetical protein